MYVFFYFENVIFKKDDHSQEHCIFGAIPRLEGFRADFPIAASDSFCCFISQLVAEEGGFAVVCKDRKWTKIATKMGFAPGKAVGSHIRGHYERILNPYNLFLSGDSLRVSGASLNLFYFTAYWYMVFVRNEKALIMYGILP